jgi:hypothetical protein
MNKEKKQFALRYLIDSCGVGKLSFISRYNPPDGLDRDELFDVICQFDRDGLIEVSNLKSTSRYFKLIVNGEAEELLESGGFIRPSEVNNVPASLKISNFYLSGANSRIYNDSYDGSSNTMKPPITKPSIDMLTPETKNAVLKDLLERFEVGQFVSIKRNEIIGGLTGDPLDAVISMFGRQGLLRIPAKGGTSDSILFWINAEAHEFYYENGGFPRVKASDASIPHVQNNYFQGHNARFNQNSIDHSTNTVHSTNDELFNSLIEVIETQISDNADILRSVIDMKSTAGTKSFTSSYSNFINLAAGHITILAPFLPQLSALLLST